jgi:oxygen-independent coproporphyrinogen-3 oxidase
MAGIYIHIPFCKQACHYCDFHFSTSLKYKDELLQALIKEINLQKTYLGNDTIETIYFGGGTPSLLSANELNLLIGTITSLHTVSADAEITIEANPDDLDKAKLQALRQTDINRFSIGIQSFFDDDLEWMNRVHRAGEAEASVKRAQDIGFENITVDLIYGYPLLNDTKWKHNLDKVFKLDIPHISSYSMTVEPQTALASFIKKKKQAAMDDQQSAEQFILLMDAMQTHETRQWNISNNAKYMQALEKAKIPAETELLTETDRLNEYIMTSLRTMWGLDLKKLNNIAKGASGQLNKVAQRYFENGWIEQKEEVIYLTPTGKLYADNIAAELFF